MNQPLNAGATRPLEGGPSYSLANRIERGSWALIWRALSWIVPHPWGWAWRRMLLRAFGAQIGTNAKVYASARVWLPRHLRMDADSTIGRGVDCYNMAPIHLARFATVSQRAFLCAGDHDHRDPNFQLVTRPISLGARCWVAAEAFVAPGVSVGEGAVLAARGVAVKDMPAWSVWGGNPAKQIGERPRVPPTS